MSFAGKVLRKLENDEPKCANCKAWAQHVTAYVGDEPQFGTVGQCIKNDAYNKNPTWFTTDLSLCSAWEQK